MTVDGTEAPRSFSYGTGIRKYDKNDPSVEKMRRDRSRMYAKGGIGTGLAAQYTLKKTLSEVIIDFKAGRKRSIKVESIKSTARIVDIVCSATGVKLDFSDRIFEFKRTITSKTDHRYRLNVSKSLDDTWRLEIIFDGVVKRRNKNKHNASKPRRRTVRSISSNSEAKIARQKQAMDFSHNNTIRGFDKLKFD